MNTVGALSLPYPMPKQRDKINSEDHFGQLQHSKRNEERLKDDHMRLAEASRQSIRAGNSSRRGRGRTCLCFALPKECDGESNHAGKRSHN